MNDNLNPYRTPNANLQTTERTFARWGFWMTCVWFVVYLLATQGLLTIGLLAGYATFNHLPVSLHEIKTLATNPDMLIQLALWVNLLSIPLILVMVLSKKGSAWRDYMAWRAVPIKQVVVWVVICMFTVYATSVAHKLLHLPESDFMDEMGAIKSVGVMLISVALIAPVIEEMVFRGFLYGGYERALGAVPALLLSAFIFTIMHAQYNRYELVHIFVLGMVLGLARMRTGSLWTSIVMHMSNNALAVLAVLAANKLGM